MRSLLLVESFDFRPCNQYILVRVIPGRFHFVKMPADTRIGYIQNISLGLVMNELAHCNKRNENWESRQNSKRHFKKFKLQSMSN
jgi:hypothetical protein